MYILRFTDADLEANRQGYLSDAQRKRLDADVDMLRRNGKYMIWFFAAFAVFAVVVGGIAEFNNAGQDLNRLFSPSNVTGFAIAGGMFTAIFVVVWVWSTWTTRRFAQGTVRTVEGKAKVINAVMRGRGMDIPIHNLEIQRGLFSKHIFRFQDAESMRSFETGRYYRVYYIAYATPQALSAEEIEEKDKR